MPTEQEELKLIVTLVDNASVGLDKIVEKSKEMGGPEVKEAQAKMTEGSKELTKVFKEMTGGFGEAFKQLTAFSGGMVAGIAGLAGFALSVGEGVKKLKELAEELRSTSQAARAIGVDPVQMKSIIEQFEAIGVNADQTKANISRMSEAIADMSRQGSQLRQWFLHQAGPTPQAETAMRDFLQQMTEAAKQGDLIAEYNALAGARQQVLNNALANGYNLQEATNRANLFASKLWDNTIAQRRKLTEDSKEEQALTRERLKQGEQLANVFGDIGSEMSTIFELAKQPFLDPMITAAETALGILKGVHELIVKIESEKLFSPPEAKESLQKPFEKFRVIPGMPSLIPQAEEQKKATEENTEAQRKQKESTDQLIDELKKANEGYSPASYQGGGFDRSMVQRASYSPGLEMGTAGTARGSPFGPWGGGPAFGGAPPTSSGAAPYGSVTGPGYGKGAGDTPAGPPTGSTQGPIDTATPGGRAEKPEYNWFQRHGHNYPFQASEMETVKTPYGPIKVNPQAAADFAGFYKDLSEANAPIKRLGSYNPRPKRWGGGWSSHAMGAATDIDDAAQLSPAMRNWIAQNPEKWSAIKEKWNIGQPLPEKDAPHLEWRGPHGSELARGRPNGSDVGAGTGAGAGDTPAHAEGATAAGGGLAAQRAAMMAEVGPRDKELLYRMMRTEGGGAPTVEALMNRTAMIRKKVPGYTIGDELRSGFYGPINSGATGGPLSENERAKYDKTLAEVVGGSDYIQGRTNQGMASDPGARLPGRWPIPGSSEVYNYWEGKRKGVGFSVSDSARFAREQIAREQLDRSAVASQKVEGSGKISVDVNAPKGTKVGAEGKGIFKDVEINRQTQMEPARKGPEVLSI